MDFRDPWDPRDPRAPGVVGGYYSGALWWIFRDPTQGPSGPRGGGGILFRCSVVDLPGPSGLSGIGNRGGGGYYSGVLSQIPPPPGPEAPEGPGMYFPGPSGPTAVGGYYSGALWWIFRTLGTRGGGGGRFQFFGFLLQITWDNSLWRKSQQRQKSSQSTKSIRRTRGVRRTTACIYLHHGGEGGRKNGLE